MQQGSAWIFDLDNTLHNAMVHVFPRINRAMTQYVQTHLNLDEADANALRLAYWKRYGATLLGLIRHHHTDPAHFLWHTRYQPKPDSYGFLRLCRSRHLRPRRCIMVEDNLDNLRTAKRLGMKTVWVSAAGTLRGKAPGYVDQTVRSVARLPSMLGQLP